MNTENISKFFDSYTRTLTEEVTAHPEEYQYPSSEVPKVIERMKVAFLRKSANWNSPAIKRTCKELGIKHGQKVIFDYLGVL